MVTKKKKAAPRSRNTASKAAPRSRRSKSGITAIPGAMATVGLIYANKDALSKDIDYFMKYGVTRGVSSFTRNQSWKKYISVPQLVNDAAFVAGGYVAGEVVKKYAPGVIKRPLGKIAKKIPKVFD